MNIRKHEIGRLQQLHGSRIEVALDLEHGPVTVTGKGIFEADDSDLGAVLRILISEPSGEFELFLCEAGWTGGIEVSSLPGCDYRISLESCAAC